MLGSQPTASTPGLPDADISNGCSALSLGSSVTSADGALPSDATPADVHLPGIGNLDGDLLQALREAEQHAAEDGIGFYVTSGWRSRDHQDQLLCDAIREHGSEEEAARWVATADSSLHVSGDAVDIGPLDASLWLSANGYRFGLCRVYSNEPWHFELRPEASRAGCPREYLDPSYDPRLQPVTDTGTRSRACRPAEAPQPGAACTEPDLPAAVSPLPVPPAPGW